MALYWQKEKVALDIVDDPFRRPFEGDDSYTVLRVTCADLLDYDSYIKVAKRLCELLGKDMPSTPQWEELSRSLHSMLAQEVLYSLNTDTLDYLSQQMDNPTYDFGAAFAALDDKDNPYIGQNMPLVIPSETDGEALCTVLGKYGQQASIADVWDGPVPPGSFALIDGNLSMSTAEFFFLRKANELPFAEAVWLGIELCGKFRTTSTKYSIDEDYEFLKYPRTDKARLRRYLKSIAGSKEYKRAKQVLSNVLEQCCSPMGCYLYIMLCLPRSRGSYGMEKPQLSAAYDWNGGFLPASSGDYMAYDLCWSQKNVVLQYTGSDRPNIKDLRALCAGDMEVVCVTDEDIADPERFDEIAHRLAELLSAPLPQETERWLNRRSKLRKQIKLPSYPHMRLIMDDICLHHVM
ncbi:MAG: hypothetical protein Q4B54_00995 [Coriobacteriales bacterium]|nr:hypothetical protein [Coriobacteriales bacterium]